MRDAEDFEEYFKEALGTKRLNLSDSYRWEVADDCEIAAYVVPFLKENPDIYFLDVGGNNGISDAIAFIIPETITSFSAFRCNIQTLGASKLAINKFLRVLNIGHNDLKGYESWLTALAENNTLLYLDASWNGIGDEGAKVLSSNNTLTELHLRYSDITDEGVIALANNKTLTTLDVSGNNITSEGAMALLNNDNITRLDIDYELIDKETLVRLASKKNLSWFPTCSLRNLK